MLFIVCGKAERGPLSRITAGRIQRVHVKGWQDPFQQLCLKRHDSAATTTFITKRRLNSELLGRGGCAVDSPLGPSSLSSKTFHRCRSSIEYLAPTDGAEDTLSKVNNAYFFQSPGTQPSQPSFPLSDTCFSRPGMPILMINDDIPYSSKQASKLSSWVSRGVS